MRRALPLAVLFSLLAAPARADVIAPGREPAPCPPGCVGGMGHGSCVISACAPDGTCRGGATCGSVKYCTHDYSGEAYVRGACATDADCTVPGDTCRESRACVAAPSGPSAGPGAPPPPAAPSGGCGCSVAHGSGGALAVIGVALALVLRRRRT